MIQDKTGVFNFTMKFVIYKYCIAPYFNCSTFSVFLDQSPPFLSEG